MESLNTFESEMEADGQGNYSLFPALDSIASLSGTPETLERFFLSNTSQSHTSGLGYFCFSNAFIYLTLLFFLFCLPLSLII